MRIVLHSVSVQCKAPRGPGSFWKCLEALVNATGVSERFVCVCHIKLDLTEVARGTRSVPQHLLNLQWCVSMLAFCICYGLQGQTHLRVHISFRSSYIFSPEVLPVMTPHCVWPRPNQLLGLFCPHSGRFQVMSSPFPSTDRPDSFHCSWYSAKSFIVCEYGFSLPWSC